MLIWNSGLSQTDSPAGDMSCSVAEPVAVMAVMRPFALQRAANPPRASSYSVQSFHARLECLTSCITAVASNVWRMLGTHKVCAPWPPTSMTHDPQCWYQICNQLNHNHATVKCRTQELTRGAAFSGTDVRCTFEGPLIPIALEDQTDCVQKARQTADVRLLVISYSSCSCYCSPRSSHHDLPREKKGASADPDK